MGWTNDLTETIIVTGPAGALVVINALPIPAELTAYYTAGSPATFIAPDHIVSVNQNFDGHGNYSYQAVVVDSSASPVTAVAFGVNIGGTVNEVSRVALNPSGGGSSNTFYEHSKITLHTGGVADLAFALLGTSQGSDINADRMQLRADGAITWGPGGTNKAQDTTLSRSGVALLGTDSDFAVTTAGKGLRVKEGSNAKMGTAVLVAGTVVVSTTAVTASSRVLLTAQNTGGGPGALRVSARVAGTSFTITSTSAADTSTVAWLLIEPA